MILYKLINFLRSRSYSQKRFIQILFDFLIVNICIVFSSAILSYDFNNLNNLFTICFITYALLGIPLFILTNSEIYYKCIF